jgi:hypothetical protein
MSEAIDQRPPRQIVVYLKEPAAERSGYWDSIERVSKILSIAAIPIVLAVIGFIVQGRLQNQTVQRDYVTLAVSILQEPDKSKAPPEMKQWAADLLNQNSPTKLPRQLLANLQSGRTLLPATKPLLSVNRLAEFRCGPSPAQEQGMTAKSAFGPDKVEHMNRAMTVHATVPPRGRLTIALTSGTQIENAFVVDAGDLSTQLRTGGNRWRNLLPIEVDNLSESPLDVIISAWHKPPPGAAETPWQQSSLRIDEKGRLIADDGINDGNSAPDLEGEFHCQEERKQP